MSIVCTTSRTAAWRVATSTGDIIAWFDADFPDEVRTQSLLDLASSLFRGWVSVDSESECSSDLSDDVDSDSGYGISGSGRHTTCLCAARPSPVHLDDCTLTSGSQADRTLLASHWPLSTSATCATSSTSRREVVDTRHIATSTQRHSDVMQIVNVTANTPPVTTGYLQLTTQPASAPAVSMGLCLTTLWSGISEC